MAAYMRAATLEAKSKASVLSRGQTDASMLVNGTMGNNMAKAPTLCRMAAYMKAATLTAKKKVSGLSHSQTDASMLVNGKMGNNMAKAP